MVNKIGKQDELATLYSTHSPRIIDLGDDAGRMGDLQAVHAIHKSASPSAPGLMGVESGTVKLAKNHLFLSIEFGVSLPFCQKCEN